MATGKKIMSINTETGISLTVSESGKEDGVWKASGVGDPSRTTVKEIAQVFKTDTEAKIALSQARKYRPFKNAQILPG